MKALRTRQRMFTLIKKIRSIGSNKSFTKYFNNSLWVFAEQCLKIVSAILVGIYVARHLGPQKFGVLSYAIALFTIATAVARLGMESILVRELVASPLRQNALLGTAFWLMGAGAVGGYLILGISLMLFESDLSTKVYVLIVAAGIFFQGFYAIEFNFQAQVRAKHSSIAKSIALLGSSLIKIYLVAIDSGLLLFTIAYAIDAMIMALFLCLAHYQGGQTNFLMSFDKSLIKPLLVSAWPMTLSALGIALYSRIDQVMIKHMLGNEALGIYSAASKIYEGWVFIPIVLSLSLLPAVVKLKAHSQALYRSSMVRLFAVVFWVSVLVAIVTTFFGNNIILASFGEKYNGGGSSLGILMWAAVVLSLRVITTRYFTVEKMERKIAFRTFVTTALNIGLNFLLIPLYGIEGAAISTLLSVFIANYLMDYLDPELKELVSMRNEAVLLRLN